MAQQKASHSGPHSSLLCPEQSWTVTAVPGREEPVPPGAAGGTRGCGRCTSKLRVPSTCVPAVWVSTQPRPRSAVTTPSPPVCFWDALYGRSHPELKSNV